MIQNNIKKVIRGKKVSINQLAEGINMHYSTAHILVHRNNLRETHLGTLVDIAEFLDVEITDLFEKVDR